MFDKPCAHHSRSGLNALVKAWCHYRPVVPDSLECNPIEQVWSRMIATRANMALRATGAASTSNSRRRDCPHVSDGHCLGLPHLTGSFASGQTIAPVVDCFIHRGQMTEKVRFGLT